MLTGAGAPLYSSTNSSLAPPGPAVASSEMTTSHASPRPSPSVSVCAVFDTVGQSSHASPTRSPSASACEALASSGQLSHASPRPSPSPSACAGSPTVGQSSHASPCPSESASAWFGLGVMTQSSQASPTPSPSLSACPTFDTAGQLSTALGTPSPSSSALQLVTRSPEQAAEAPPSVGHSSLPMQPVTALVQAELSPVTSGTLHAPQLFGIPAGQPSASAP